MNRRAFIKLTGLSALALALGAGGYFSFFRTKESKLSSNLNPFFDPLFKDAGNNKEPGDILAALRSKGVINEKGEVNAEVVKKMAKTDEIIKYKGHYYSQTELELYSFAYLINGGSVLLLKGHDLMGGDYHSFKASNSNECLKACESAKKCSSFTYAKPNHPNPKKQNSCWLKDKSVKYNVDDNYISGVK